MTSTQQEANNLSKRAFLGFIGLCTISIFHHRHIQIVSTFAILLKRNFMKVYLQYSSMKTSY